MVFSSLVFLCIFFPLSLLLYNLSKSIKYKNIILVITSIIFYSWGEPIWITAMLFSSIVDFNIGLIIDKYRGHIQAKIAIISSVVVNLGLLGVFKYSNFIVENINVFLGTHIYIPKISLPLGISFYTFQTLSYTVDMYRNEIKVQKSFLKFFTYVSMFPQLVAGPIVRYIDIEVCTVSGIREHP